jgi:hypothetical protein
MLNEAQLMKKDFKAMSRSDLKAYVLANSSDTEAFHELVDRFNASPNIKQYAPEDAERFSEIYEEHQKQRREMATS